MTKEYCICGKSQSGRRQNGRLWHLYCLTCGKDYHPENFLLIDRLRENWEAWGSPTDRDKCVNETCMAMDCKEAADELDRLMRGSERDEELSTQCSQCGLNHGACMC